MSPVPEDATITMPAEQLYRLALALAEAGEEAAKTDPRFAHGWLACCDAVRQIGDEQARRGLT